MTIGPPAIKAEQRPKALVLGPESVDLRSGTPKITDQIVCHGLHRGLPGRPPERGRDMLDQGTTPFLRKRGFSAS